jgi:hypothetical protein
MLSLKDLDFVAKEESLKRVSESIETHKNNLKVG